MRLIGMLDSPFVRRVAVSMHLMDLPFTGEQISVHREIARFRAINPVIKAPTLVLDDETVLFESSLILEFLERIVPPERSLQPADLDLFIRSQRLIALALAVCEKSVQVVYETTLRPEERQHAPWLDRVQAQLQAALTELESLCAGTDGWLLGERPMQADISTACAWRFSNEVVRHVADATAYPALAALSARAEATDAFRRSPFP